MAFYVLDDHKNKVEAYDKEGLLALLEQIIEDQSLSGIDADTAFVTKIKGAVDGQTHKISFVTEAQYNELEQAGQIETDAYYFITDDTTAEDLESAIEELRTEINSIKDGTYPVSIKKANGNMAQITETASGVLKNDTVVICQKKVLWSGSYSIPTDQTEELSLDISNGDKLEITAEYDGQYFKGYMEVYNNYGCKVSMTEIDTSVCNIRSFSVLFASSKLKIFNPCSALYASSTGTWTLVNTANIHLTEIAKIIQ